LPGTTGIAEKGLDAEGFVKPVMLGELGSVVEADGFAHHLWKLAELAGDGPSGKNGFSIERMLNDAEAGLPFVENKQPLAISGEHMKSDSQWPGTSRPSTSAGRSVIARRCLMKLAELPPGRLRRPRLCLWRGSRRCQ
jgi:hypothetical protein